MKCLLEDVLWRRAAIFRCSPRGFASEAVTRGQEYRQQVERACVTTSAPVLLRRPPASQVVCVWAELQYLRNSQLWHAL